MESEEELLQNLCGFVLWIKARYPNVYMDERKVNQGDQLTEIFQAFIVLSHDPVKNTSGSRNAMQVTGPVWPLYICRVCPVSSDKRLAT